MNTNNMRNLLNAAVCLAALWGVGVVACTKDRSCENCLQSAAANQPPLAVAGPDLQVVLPQDSVWLDGSASTDPDGRVVAYQWKQVGATGSSNLQPADAARVLARSLAAGAYLFELTVTDDQGATARDTVQVTVQQATSTNLPPVALAGGDQTLTLPANLATLDGSASYDPDGTLTSYQWARLDGPTIFIMDRPTGPVTGLGNLSEGVYRFVLTVTDNGGLKAYDTVQLTVRDATTDPSLSCNTADRPLLQARLVPLGQLSIARSGIAVAAAGQKVLFAGGTTADGVRQARVDIYDVATGSFRTAELSGPGTALASAALGNRVLLAGGMDGNSGSLRVDIYDAVTNTWTLGRLGTGRFHMVGAAAGGKALFAGGMQYFSVYRDQVDIYDEASGSWSDARLNNRTGTGTVGIATAVLGNKVYFAGEASGWLANGLGSYSSVINVYDATTNTWSVAALKTARGYMAGLGVGGKLYWAGGVVGQPAGSLTSEVEIMEAATGTSTFGCLFQPNASFSAVQKNNYIVFFTGQGRQKHKFDIYNTATGTWSIGVLPVSMEGSSIISVNNTLYVAGGKVNGVLSNGVWKLEF